MTKKRKRTEKSKYKHQTTGDHCTCAAYVAEVMCLRYAEHKNQGSLPYKFWNVKPWDWTFKRQLVVANKLLKKYSEAGLVKAIHSPEFKRIFSLNNSRATKIIERYDKITKEQKEIKQQAVEIKDNPETRKKTYGKKSKLSKLRSIEKDGKEKE